MIVLVAVAAGEDRHDILGDLRDRDCMASRTGHGDDDTIMSFGVLRIADGLSNEDSIRPKNERCSFEIDSAKIDGPLPPPCPREETTDFCANDGATDRQLAPRFRPLLSSADTWVRGPARPEASCPKPSRVELDDREAVVVVALAPKAGLLPPLGRSRNRPAESDAIEDDDGWEEGGGINDDASSACSIVGPRFDDDDGCILSGTMMTPTGGGGIPSWCPMGRARSSFIVPVEVRYEL